MAKTTGIEWASATWNPWMGCAKVSEGCKHCYMFRDQERYGHDPTELRISKTTFEDPLKWKEPRRIFVCSWSDFFLETVPREWRTVAWTIMRHCQHHTFMLLTKRPENIETMIPTVEVGPGVTWPYPNVWLGVSAENQRRADERIPLLLQVPAAVHFVSAEPLLGPIILADEWLPITNAIGPAISWVICGGESRIGQPPRPTDSAWVESIRDQCVETGVAFFFKQWGGTRKLGGAWGGRYLGGRTWDQFPDGRP